jgi:hypothetical protein
MHKTSAKNAVQEFSLQRKPEENHLRQRRLREKTKVKREKKNENKRKRKKKKNSIN